MGRRAPRRASPPATRALVLFVFLGSCLTPSRNDAVLLPDGAGDRRIQEACAVTARTCSRCHEIDRVLVARLDTPREWQRLVERMRLMRSSAMTDAEADAAVTCLVYRRHGQAGLDALAAAGGAP